MKILIVAYYFKPFNGVGAKRPSYWFDRLEKLGIDTTVLTATKQIEENNKVIYLPPSETHKNIFIKDDGINWKPALISFLNDSSNFDIILLTGGPFMHFGVSSFLKKKYKHLKVVLDFRDPFAINPRFKNNFFKVLVKRYFERKFIKNSDFVITVNKYCLQLLGLKNRPNTAIINNGFDERILDVIKSDLTLESSIAKVKIAYAGSFAKDRNPIKFIEALKPFEDQINFHYIGPNLNQFTSENSYIIDHGFKTYNDTISLLKACDYGIIFTSGSPFESTTKVFDYIACKLRILIISPDGIPNGSLHDITKDYPNVVWLANDVKVINDYLKSMRRENTELETFNFNKFSRAEGFNRLLDVFDSICVGRDESFK